MEDSIVCGLKMKVIRGRVSAYLMLIAVFVLAQPLTMQTFALSGVSFGDRNVEPYQGTIGGNVVQAYTLVTITKPTVFQSVSMYLAYSGSDGSQCMLFGIYADNGSGSPVGQPLVAYTKNAYCLHGSGSWGPAWQTWNLKPGDYLTITQPGQYWLSTLASQTFGSIYHYAYTGTSYDYTYGYANYFLAGSFQNGFPTVFSNYQSVGSGYGWESNGPYSFYMTGTQA